MKLPGVRLTPGSIVAATLIFLFAIAVESGWSQASLTVAVVSGASVVGSVTPAAIESGFVEILDQTELQVVANTDWQVTASVVINSSPAGTGNPSNLSLEVGNNDSPGQFNAGGGLVQTGASGTHNLTVDFRMNLVTLGDAPAGSFNYTVTYQVTQL